MSAARQLQPHPCYNHHDMSRFVFQNDDLSLAAKLVAEYLNHRANEIGDQWHNHNPSVAQIVKETKLGRTSVYRAFNELEKAGLLTRTRQAKASGRQTVNGYRIHLPTDITEHLSVSATRTHYCKHPKNNLKEVVRKVCSTPVLVPEPTPEPENDTKPGAHEEPESSAPVLSVVKEVETQPSNQQPQEAHTRAPVTVYAHSSHEGTGARKQPTPVGTRAGLNVSARRLPAWLAGASRLDSPDTTPEEITELIERVQWDNTRAIRALLHYYVPWLVLDWAATEAEDAVAGLGKGDPLRLPKLRQKFRFKLRDWARGEDGPNHERKDNLSKRKGAPSVAGLSGRAGVNYNLDDASDALGVIARLVKGGE